MVSRVAPLIFVAAAVGANGPSARADESKEVSDAKTTFQHGLEEYDAHRYPEALDLFEHAYELSAKPEIIFDIAETHAAMDECQKAVDALDRLIAAVGPSDGPLLSRAHTRRQELLPCHQQTRASKVAQDTSTPDTPVATHPSRQPTPPGDAAVIPGPPQPAPTLQTTSTPLPHHSPWQPTFLAAAGASAALLASGVVLGVEAHSSESTVESSTTWNNQAMLADQRGRTQADAAVGLLIASAAAAAFCAVAYVLWHTGR